MNTTEKIPKAMAEKFSAIATLTDAFCAQHLHAQYRQMILHVLGALARKRPSPPNRIYGRRPDILLTFSLAGLKLSAH